MFTIQNWNSILCVAAYVTLHSQGDWQQESPSVTACNVQKIPTVRWLLVFSMLQYMSTGPEWGSQQARTGHATSGPFDSAHALHILGRLNWCAQAPMVYVWEVELNWEYLNTFSINTFFFLDVTSNYNLFSRQIIWIWFNVKEQKRRLFFFPPRRYLER